jgi:hypothetical protein
VESQLLVFSKTSLQGNFISPGNPRAIFFNDAAAVAWIRGSATLEVAAHDPRQGVIFYTLDQGRQTRPVLARDQGLCIGCHQTPSSLGVPGTIIRSVFPKDTGALATGLIGSEADHRMPFAERWGGWYATGKSGPLFHRANAVVDSVSETRNGAAAGSPRREPLPERFSTTGYPAPYSDVIALSVFEHQVHMMNQLTRIGWEARIALHQKPDRSVLAEERFLSRQVREFVDYLLFIDEAAFTAKIEGTSGFAEKFAGLGPFDGKGRSLRQFNLQTRLMRYPCSYMIYSDAFRSLPPEAKKAIYSRMWVILSGSEKDPRYGVLSLADRRAIVEILRETVEDLPEYFKPF